MNQIYYNKGQTKSQFNFILCYKGVDKVKYKTCSKCGAKLPATTDYFHKNGHQGLRPDCKSCSNKYYKANKEKFQQYYQDNWDTINERNKKYNKEHEEELKEYRKDYAKTISGKVSCFNSQSRRRFKENYIHDITIDMFSDMMEFFDYRCGYSGREFSDNYTFDHIKSRSKGGEHAIWNIIPCIDKVNFNKHSKDFLTWYKSSEYYSKERLDKIEAWQLYSFNKWKHKRG